MEKWTNKITSQLDRFQQRVTTLLENEPLTNPDPKAPPFEPSRDAALVRGLTIGLPEQEMDRAIVLFGRLSALFDAGLLFEIDGGEWVPQLFFKDGIVRPDRRENPPRMKFPQTAPLSALRTPAKALLERAALTKLDPEAKCDAILLRPVPNFTFVLMSSLPDLWLKDHMEKVVASLASGFAE